MMVVHSKKNGTLYLTSQGCDLLVIADSKVSSSLWHNRLVHMSDEGIKVMQSHGKLTWIGLSQLMIKGVRMYFLQA